MRIQEALLNLVGLYFSVAVFSIADVVDYQTVITYIYVQIDSFIAMMGHVFGWRP